MSESFRTKLSLAVIRILKPLVRILLRNGMTYGDFAELAKKAYVDVATEQFQLPGRKASASRTSLITGISRKEISRIQKISDEESISDSIKHNRIAKILSGWMADANFRQDHVLRLEGSKHSFAELVKKYSGDVPAKTVLDELLRINAVELENSDSVRLLQRGYIPVTDDQAKLHMLGTDVATLIETIDHNICVPDQPNFQRKVQYDSLPLDIPKFFRPIAARKAQQLLEELNDILIAHDRDMNNVPVEEDEARVQAGVGIYYFENTID